ncbi:MAG: tetratricopeptide repeat protein [Chloroflexi bacterium]|nr:tetratricopeptide repeat protein [Chloroflexota bacterium]
MHCEVCGTRLPEGALVCPYCGYEMRTEQRNDQPSLTPPLVAEPVGEEEVQTAPRRGCGRWAMLLGLVVGFSLLLVVGLGIVGVYQGLQDRNRTNRTAAAAHYDKGLAAMAQGNYELAEAEFELAVSLNPGHSEAAAKLVEVRALLQGSPTPTPGLLGERLITLYNEARQAYNRQDWGVVINRLEEIVSLDPAFERDEVRSLLFDAYRASGLQLVGEDRLEEAIRYFDQALQLRPGDLDVLTQRQLASLYLTGLSYWGADWERAIEAFRTLYSIQPQYKDARQRLIDAYVAHGDVLATKGDYCKARDQYQQALDIAPDPRITAKRDDAATQCASGTPPPGTPGPSGYFVGRLVRYEAVEEGKIYVRGRVLDEKGNPIPGVRVGISAFDWSAPPATTNYEGIYAFDGLANEITFTLTLVDLPHVPFDVHTYFGKLVWVDFQRQP